MALKRKTSRSKPAKKEVKESFEANLEIDDYKQEEEEVKKENNLNLIPRKYHKYLGGK